MRISSLLVLIIVVFPGVGLCQQDALELLQEYAVALDKGPFLKEGLRYDGEEVELEHELKACEDFGWETHGATCIAFTRIRACNTETVPSLHLSWLRTKLPRAPYIKVLSAKDVSQGQWKAQAINARFNDVAIVFYRNLNMHLEGPFGELHVVEIDGEKVEQLWQKDRKAGFSPTEFVDPEFSDLLGRLNWEGVISN